MIFECNSCFRNCRLEIQEIRDDDFAEYCPFSVSYVSWWKK